MRSVTFLSFWVNWMVDFFRLNVIVLFICGVKNKTMEFSHSRTEARLKISIGVFEILDLQPLSVSHKKNWKRLFENKWRGPTLFLWTWEEGKVVIIYFSFGVKSRFFEKRWPPTKKIFEGKEFFLWEWFLFSFTIFMFDSFKNTLKFASALH